MYTRDGKLDISTKLETPIEKIQLFSNKKNDNFN